MNDRRSRSSDESDGDLRCREPAPMFWSDSDDESARLERPVSSHARTRVVKEDSRWNLATYHLRREIGERTARERAWIETSIASSARASDYMRRLPLRYYHYYQSPGGEKRRRLHTHRCPLLRDLVKFSPESEKPFWISCGKGVTSCSPRTSATPTSTARGDDDATSASSSRERVAKSDAPGDEEAREP